MATIQEAIQMAVGHHQAGRLPQAEQLYQEILRGDPQQPDALHLLGLVWHQSGNHDAALDSIRRAVALLPDNPAFLSNLGTVYRAVDRLDVDPPIGMAWDRSFVADFPGSVVS